MWSGRAGHGRYLEQHVPALADAQGGEQKIQQEIGCSCSAGPYSTIRSVRRNRLCCFRRSGLETASIFALTPSLFFFQENQSDDIEFRSPDLILLVCTPHSVRSVVLNEVLLTRVWVFFFPALIPQRLCTPPPRRLGEHPLSTRALRELLMIHWHTTITSVFKGESTLVHLVDSTLYAWSTISSPLERRIKLSSLRRVVLVPKSS